MKVICIDASNPRVAECNDCGDKTMKIKEGEKYEASQCGFNTESFDIAEDSVCSCGRKKSYAKFRFIPCSNIDEREYQTNYETLQNILP